MALDVGRSLVSAGVGVADEVMEWWDETAGRTESFRTARDIGRLVIAGLGYGLQIFMPRYSKLGETLALSSTPLVVKSIAKPIRGAVTSGARQQSQQSFVPRKRAAAPQVGAAPASPVGRSYYPEATPVLMQ